MGYYLSQEFLSQYSEVKSRNKGKLFDIIRLGRYSRRPETWGQLCERVTEYSLSLYQGPANYDDLKNEAELMYDLMFHCIAFPAGRTMKIGGTEACDKYPESCFNCSFMRTLELNDICDLFHLSMCSCGVGFSVYKDDIKRLPKINPNIEVLHEKFNGLYPYVKVEDTETSNLGWQGEYQVYRIVVGDSKQGWVESIKSYLNIVSSHLVDKVKIVLNYDYVRPAGSPLKTWGGYAAGHEGLEIMYNKITKILNKSSEKLRPIDIMDIDTIIAANVVVGGSRRAALICLFSDDDEEMLNAKSKENIGYWIDSQTKEETEYDQLREINKEIEWKNGLNDHRTMSNNSITFTKKPTYERLRDIFERIKYNGEPGFFNLEAARKRRPNVFGMNPCSEILLDSQGVCNLTTVNMMAFLDENNCIDYALLEKAVRLITRIGLRQTNVTLSLPKWDYVQKRDRLLGVSKTGEMDLLDSIGWTRNCPEHLNLHSRMKEWANSEADKYAYEMRVPRPLLVTCSKPEGTLSLLPTVSCGIHRSFSPYYVRRIRFADFDPMCKTLQSLNVPWEKDRTKKDSTRIVFSFPIKTSATIAANNESLNSQFYGYIYNQEYYADHNTSCTLYVGEDEWQEALDLTYKHWDDMIAVTFLKKELKGAYIQPPYEQITKDQYEELMKNFPGSLDGIDELIAGFEGNIHDSTSMEESAECSSGACPAV